MQALSSKDPELANLIEKFALSEIWMREGLNLREKIIVTLSSQITAQKWDQVKKHMHSFIRAGGTTSELKSICIHLSLYCGFPTMLSAIEILESLEIEDKKKR
jgi:4-carboxymuconolactone decarboxylase